LDGGCGRRPSSRRGASAQASDTTPSATQAARHGSGGTIAVDARTPNPAPPQDRPTTRPGCGARADRRVASSPLPDEGGHARQRSQCKQRRIAGGEGVRDENGRGGQAAGATPGGPPKPCSSRLDKPRLKIAAVSAENRGLSRSSPLPEPT